MSAATPGAGSTATAVAGGRPLRFVVVGAVNTLFGLSLFPLLLWTFPIFDRWYFAALLIAQAVGTAFAFALHRTLVFRSHGPLLREFATFCSFYLAIYAANWVALPLLVEVAHVRPLMAQIGFAAVTLIGSYLWHARVTFRARSPEGIAS